MSREDLNRRIAEEINKELKEFCLQQVHELRRALTEFIETAFREREASLERLVHNLSQALERAAAERPDAQRRDH
jgi:hypothetical protein